MTDDLQNALKQVKAMPNLVNNAINKEINEMQDLDPNKKKFSNVSSATNQMIEFAKNGNQKGVELIQKRIKNELCKDNKQVVV